MICHHYSSPRYNGGSLTKRGDTTVEIRERLIATIRHEDKAALTALLQPLTEKSRRELNALLKSVTAVSPSEQKWRLPNSPEKLGKIRCELVKIAAARVMNQRDALAVFQKTSPEFLESEVLPWYCPPWILRHLRARYTARPIPFAQLYRYIAQGWITPDAQTIAASFVRIQNHASLDAPAVEACLWTLFETEVMEEAEFRRIWLPGIVDLTQRGLASRPQVLEASLQSIGRDFGRVLSEWYARLFETLKPNGYELIQLQPSLLPLLGSKYPKVVTVGLKSCQLIAAEPDFDVDGFISQAPALLAWNVKQIVSTTLALFDTLMATRPESAVICTQALAMPDEALQIKTLKLLARHHRLDDAAVLDAITMYRPTLFAKALALLPDTLYAEPEASPVTPTPIRRIREDNRIASPESFDDLLFFYLQLFNSPEPWHFDLFLDTFPWFRQQDMSMDKCLPLFEKAYRIKRLTVRQLQFVIRFDEPFRGYHMYLVAETLCTYWEETLNQPPPEQKGEGFEDPTLFFGSGWDMHEIFRSLLDSRQYCAPLPMLSMPTHTPCWIDARTLIERIAAYQTAGGRFHIYDWQIALERVILDDVARPLIDAMLTDEPRAVLHYLFGEGPFDSDAVITPEYWITALLRRNERSTIDTFARTFDTANASSSIYQTPTAIKPLSVEAIAFHSIYHRFSLSSWQGTRYNEPNIDPADVSRQMLLMPTRPDLPLATLLYFIDGDLDGFNDVCISILKLLFETWEDTGTMRYLFLATMLLLGNAEEGAATVELWTETVEQQMMNSLELGILIGELEKIDNVALMHLNRQVLQMLGVSDAHNRELETMLGGFIAHVGDPARGMKKVLEYYLETLTRTGNTAPTEVILKLQAWKQRKTLAPVIRKIGKANKA